MKKILTFAKDYFSLFGVMSALYLAAVSFFPDAINTGMLRGFMIMAALGPVGNRFILKTAAVGKFRFWLRRVLYVLLIAAVTPASMLLCEVVKPEKALHYIAIAVPALICCCLGALVVGDILERSALKKINERLKKNS